MKETAAEQYIPTKAADFTSDLRGLNRFFTLEAEITLCRVFPLTFPTRNKREVCSMLRKATAVALAAGVLAPGAFAQENRIPAGIPHLDHVFVIMMENHGYQQVIGNPNEPYLNNLISSGKVNLATNYFAVGHPSLTNYLEVVGGSNFAVRSDNAPAWGSTSCTPNIASGEVNADNGGGNAPVPVESGRVCPIYGTGRSAARRPRAKPVNRSGPMEGWPGLKPADALLEFALDLRQQGNVLFAAQASHVTEDEGMVGTVALPPFRREELGINPALHQVTRPPVFDSSSAHNPGLGAKSTLAHR